VSCGDTITGDAVMTGNLVCATNPGVTIAGGELDMHGFSLSCGAPANTGIAMTTSGGKVMNGSVDSCLIGVHLGGTGKHTVLRMRALSNNYAFQSDLLSGGNKLTENVAVASGVTAFNLQEGGNTLVGNTSLASGFDAFFTGAGKASKIVDNISVGDGNNGISSDGAGSTIKGNLVWDSGAAGMVTTAEAKIGDNVIAASTGNGLIQVGGTKMSKNTIFGNGAGGVIFHSGIVGATSNLIVLNGTLNSDHGIEVITAGPVQLKNNLVAGNSGRGLSLVNAAGSGYVVAGNTTLGNGVIGIALSASNSIISENAAIGHPVADSLDTNVNCGTNVWSGNIIGLASQPCEQQ